MANERTTERFVRGIISEYEENPAHGPMRYYEQYPADNTRISKYLKTASKRGTGNRGSPEFTIQFKQRPEFLTVIECKPDVQLHESVTRTEPIRYCVDGALHYARHLSKGFNVLAIAVSGTARQHLRSSYYFHYKSEPNTVTAIENSRTLLSLEESLDLYFNQEKTYRQDTSELLSFTKELNKDLHILKIKSADRSLLIAAILTALQDSAFKNSYQEQGNASLLMKQIKNTVLTHISEQVQSNISKNLSPAYAFMDQDNQLLIDENLLEIVGKIDEKIGSFEKTHTFYDALGQFYVEFLKYSNDDRGLGIVLTPPHITELAAEIIDVGKGDVVFDNCAGTGGFLISSMKRMVAQANENKKELNRIKKKGIIGLEIEPSIIPLLCSNMFVHNDGQSNVYLGDALLDGSVELKQIAEFKPNKGLLNPPFKMDKDDREEFEFVLANLDCLQRGAKCAAVMPMQCALAGSGSRLALKETLLQNHTLEAVLSLPNEAFHQTAGTIACLMVFTAHVPHPKNKQVWVAWCKDDGFEVKKHIGRVDVDNRWPEIKDDWIESFRNRISKQEFSFRRTLRARDEWCAEPYIQRSFDRIGTAHFESTLRSYLSSMFSAGRLDQIERDALNDYSVALDAENWVWFQVSAFMDITLGKYTPKSSLRAGSLPYITRTALNNGVSEYGYADEIYPGNCITIGAEGVVAFYQPTEFLKGNKINVLTCKDLNAYRGLFLCTILDYVNVGLFNYGYALVKKRLTHVSVKLPAVKGPSGDVIPDWEYMEDFMSTLSYSSNIGIVGVNQE